ncbi:L,D-transpeptidase family protein [Pelagibacterium xiamenense]|uniref:L,D-transpeptidase family protein n=1 Tax=Pelagibacterium xiamenense TaxID=2901140 RepID=UPI001E352476|nr:L,D-transpeptidase family protein [Pelagibacterium xiamenense]MCD7060509.1 L,D-transpeptidase family protein [Pelagibacterium xiamenense]
MKKIILGALAGLSALALSSTAFALESVVVGGVEATRIVIAPPQNPLATTIRQGLREAVDAAPNGSRSQTDARQLYYFYGARHFEPLWLTEDQDGTIAFSAKAQDVIELFEDAHLQGLDPDDYLTAELDVQAAAGDPQALAALEGAFSAAMLRYAQDAHSGRLDPRTVSGYIDTAPKRIDESALFDALAAADDPADVLMSYHPTHREFVALRDLLARHYAGEIEAPIVIGEGKLLRPGMTDLRVPALRERLGVSAPEDETLAPDLYDETLVAAVEAFQGELGLNVDGVVGPATVAALNGANGATIPDIVANMERWRWMPEDLGDFAVLVNVPEFRLDVMRDGHSAWNTRVIVGTVKNQTPLFSDLIRHVVTNPYWNVPSSILRNEVMPRVLSNPGYIASQNMELLSGGRAVDPWSVDWTQANPNQFRVRQRPGTSNALGQVKFLFPNSHDVYLHDTNARGLFARSMRALSHGCIRVQDPFAFAEALLEYEPGITVAALQSTLGGGERWFNMEREVPVHIAYFTLRVGEDGKVRSYGDIYGHNARVIEMLGM